jgi:hypothetical protein
LDVIEKTNRPEQEASSLINQAKMLFLREMMRASKLLLRMMSRPDKTLNEHTGLLRRPHHAANVYAGN